MEYRKFVISTGSTMREFHTLERANAARRENPLAYGRIIAEYTGKPGLFGKMKWHHVADHIGK